jgi:signal peptidase I
VQRRLLRVLIVITLLLALVSAVRLWVLTPFHIPTSSMEPTLLGEKPPEHPGDTVVLNRLAYLASDPVRWDVVVFVSQEGGAPVNVVKRVVGLPGETVLLAGDDVLIDGEPPARPPGLEGIRYIRRGSHGVAPITLGPREYFVLGDNSYLSQDSRAFGPVARDSIIGRVEWILLPWSRRGCVR